MAPTKPLTTSSLRAWQDSHGHTYESGAEAFGVSRATYARWLDAADPPKLVLLALAALQAGLHPPPPRADIRP